MGGAEILRERLPSFIVFSSGKAIILETIIRIADHATSKCYSDDCACAIDIKTIDELLTSALF